MLIHFFLLNTLKIALVINGNYHSVWLNTKIICLQTLQKFHSSKNNIYLELCISRYFIWLKKVDCCVMTDYKCILEIMLVSLLEKAKVRLIFS